MKTTNDPQTQSGGLSGKEVSRRQFLASAAVAGVALTANSVLAQESTPGSPAASKGKITIASNNYDRVQALQNGQVTIPDYKIDYTYLDIYQLNQNAFGKKTFEVTEVGLLPFMSSWVNDDFRDYQLLPIPMSRTFRHRNIFIRSDRGIKRPEDLRGKTVGTPGYGTSAATWIRGMLQHSYGVKPEEISWIDTVSDDFNASNVKSKPTYNLPKNFPLKEGPTDRTDSQMLAAGEIDAIISPITPKVFLDKTPNVARLFPDYRTVEQDYYKATGLFPIMHVLAIRQDVAKRQAGLPQAICQAFSNAKKKTYADLGSSTVLSVMLPWVTADFEQTVATMGKNYWPYGIEPNRKALEAIFEYAYEQGIVKRKLTIEELFLPAALSFQET